MKNKSIVVKFLILVSVLFFSREVFAGTATLTWNANTEPDLASYKVYYDTVSRTGTLPCASAGYASNINVGNVTTYNFSNLTDGATYYFAISAYDTTGNESACSSQQSKVIADTTAPTVTGITVPATSSSLTVSITGFTATDSVGVTGYLVNESATAPTSGATGWSSTAPTSYTFTTQGSKTLYAWAKDAAGNVSTSVSRSVTVTLADTTAPVVTFTIPSTSSSLTASFTSFTATDSVGVTGYLVNESATAPTSGATGWTSNAPASYTFTTQGSKTLYAWAKDAAGNVSTSVSRSVTVTLSDTTAPTVTFTTPSTSSSLSVSFTGFTATDDTAVTGYMVNESSTAPTSSATGWSSTAPSAYTFTTQGSKTLYAWAKDAAGNVSTSVSRSVTVTLPVSTYTIGGTISGLSGTVVLQNNGGDALTRSSAGSFTFATALSNSASYAVTILTQPSGQTCSVSSGSGTVSSANVTNVSVSCQTNVVSCSESWACSGWSTCSSSSQSRTCTDSNSCGTTTNKPSVSQSCTSSGGGGGGGGSYLPPAVPVPPVDPTPPITATTTLTVPSSTSSFTISNPPASSGALIPVVIRNLKIADESKTFIKEGQTIAGQGTIFEALVFDADGSKVRLEVEIRNNAESFTGTPTIMSSFVPSGSTLQLKKGGIAAGTYKVRARTKKESSAVASDWLDFGSPTIADFTLKFKTASFPALPAIKGPFSLITVSSEVPLLKQVLNSLGFTVSNTTTRYDKETATAVKAFQKANGIEYTGIAGPQTRAKLNTAYQKLSGTQAPQIQTPQTQVSVLKANLKRGSISSEVTLLQTMLSKDKAIYPEQSVTGTFGPATERAVIRFQKKYNITPAVGFVGPATRAKMGEVLK